MQFIIFFVHLDEWESKADEIGSSGDDGGGGGALGGNANDVEPDGSSSGSMETDDSETATVRPKKKQPKVEKSDEPKKSHLNIVFIGHVG